MARIAQVAWGATVSLAAVVGEGQGEGGRVGVGGIGGMGQGWARHGGGAVRKGVTVAAFDDGISVTRATRSKGISRRRVGQLLRGKRWRYWVIAQS